MEYEYVEEDKKNGNPIRIYKLTPIQMPHVDMEDLKAGCKAFTKEEWINVLLRSIGMEPDELEERVKWLFNIFGETILDKWHLVFSFGCSLYERRIP